MAKVLLVDDEMTMVQMVTELLRSEGHQVVPFTNGHSALEALSNLNPELVIANLCSDKGRVSGFSVLQKARSLSPPAVSIMITANGSLETAIESMRKGAYDYLTRPFTLDELKLRVQRALSYQAALSENVYLRKQLQSKYQFKEIVGTSPLMLQVLKLVERIADTDSSVLICGPVGSGKELIARALHFNSRRRFGPFVVVGCSMVPDHLLESQLFGCRKTALTTQVTETPGLLEEANGGTVLLDGIGGLSSSMQGRLWRILHDREVRRIGDETSTPLDVRILAANDENLERKVAAGAFREDLYGRFSAMPIALPSLHERSEDVPLLIAHFLESKIHRQSNTAFTMAADALEACCRYEWPGNVRELENAIERACVVSKNCAVQVADLPPAVQRFAPALVLSKAAPSDSSARINSIPATAGSGPIEQPVSFLDEQIAAIPGELIPLKQFLRGQELSYLHRTLAQVGGSKERAAELLGISLATIYRKLSEDDGYGPSVERSEPVAPCSS
jgi:DNA-binding NtrC family response regulator